MDMSVGELLRALLPPILIISATAVICIRIAIKSVTEVKNLKNGELHQAKILSYKKTGIPYERDAWFGKVRNENWTSYYSIAVEITSKIINDDYLVHTIVTFNPRAKRYKNKKYANVFVYTAPDGEICAELKEQVGYKNKDFVLATIMSVFFVSLSVFMIYDLVSGIIKQL